ncbi:MAG: family 16 glycoside hydrolase, partial [Prosthecobacter sp.]
SQKVHSIDPRFGGIVRRAMEHDRGERYQTGHQRRRDLDIILPTPLAGAGQQSSAALPKQQQPAQQTPGRTVVPGPRNAASSMPTRPGPYFEPSPSQPAPAPASSLPYAIAAILMLAAGGWFLLKDRPHAEPTPVAVVETPPAGTPTAIEGKKQPTNPPKISTAPTQTPGPTPPAGRVVPPVVSIPPSPGPRTTPAIPTTPPQAPAISIADRLATMESEFQATFEREVNAAFAEQIALLGANYTAALERSLNDATRAGKLDEAIALRDEKQRFTTHKFMPSIDPASLHSTISRLRSLYRGAEKKLAQQKDATSLPRYDHYLQALAAYERELMSQGKQADASRVRIKREDVTTRRAQRAAKVPAGTTVLPAAPRTSSLDLFDGRSLNGWRIVGDPNSFAVADGEIRTNGRPGNLIYVGTGGTAPVWRDFSLEIKVKCEDHANSGVWLHIPDAATIINRKVSAFEVNIDEHRGGDTGGILAAVELSSGAPLDSQMNKQGKGRFGAGKYPPSGGRFGQWQSMRITAKQGLFTVWIDGRQVNQWAFPPLWLPPQDKGYLQTFQGTVGLQSNGGSVAFKDISVELL